MKVAHWVNPNGSGMGNVAVTLSAAERLLGLDSILVNIMEADETKWNVALDADIHVVHTNLPEQFRKKLPKNHKIVWVCHGTPEVSFISSVEAQAICPHGCGDGIMLTQYWLKTADAIVTFWPRHADIFRSMSRKGAPIHCVPLGVDLSYWKKVPSLGHFAGAPAILSLENCYSIKWPLDLIIAWPWVYPKLSGNASLHILHVPYNLHRFLFPLADANGAAFHMHMTGTSFVGDSVRNAYCSVDFYIGLVRYGDFNRNSLEANACGCKTISYTGNPFSDFWVPEGDQRVIAEQLVEILDGRVEPRKKTPVPDAAETAAAMKHIYETLT